MRKTILYSCLLSIGLLMACSSSEVVAEDGANEPAAIQVSNATRLADLFIRLPGVMVDERSGIPEVFIRGRRPLYVVDGMPIGHSYREVENMLNVTDVASVEVLRNLHETALYGRQGSNGVILIRTIVSSSRD